MRAVLVFAACAGPATCATLAALGSARGSHESTGARLSLDWFADTDVTGFHLEVRSVPCHRRLSAGSVTIEANYELDQGRSPFERLGLTPDRIMSIHSLNPDRLTSLEEIRRSLGR